MSVRLECKANYAAHVKKKMSGGLCRRGYEILVNVVSRLIVAYNCHFGA